MEMLRSDIAFVLHTVNPLDRDEAVLSAEMAVGLGETLASGTRGSPWRFAIDKANGALRQHCLQVEGVRLSVQRMLKPR
jgi:phosphoglucan,water dikinase